MRIVDFPQGSDAWLAHRRTTRNASEAPIVMGASPYVTRAELIRQRATGVEREIDAATQYVFDRGHEVEPKLRALAEAYTGEDFYPITATSDDGYLSASFDGVTLDETALLEAKQSNAGKMAQARDGILPPADRWQVIHQFAVCETATRCLYVIGDGTEEGSVILTVQRSEIEADIPKLLAGWAQFDADVAAYQAEPEVLPPAAGRAPDQLPALSISVTGMVTASNLAEFKANALAVLGNINRDLRTDEDFADAEKTVKWCKGVEERIEATKQQVLGQTADIEAVFRTMDEVAAETRRIRLELDKQVTKDKDARKAEIVAAGAAAVRAHYDSINATLGAHAFQPAQSLTLDLGAAIKGKRTLTSMRDAVDSAVAREKIEASQRAERVRACIAVLQEDANEFRHLFADAVQLCATKHPDDLRNLVAARVAEHQKREAERIEAERERIRKEESDRLEREQQERERAQVPPANDQQYTPRADDTERMPAAAGGGMAGSTGALRAAGEPGIGIAETAQPLARLKLGAINAAIAPLSVTADGLASLGFRPVGTAGAAKLYDADQFDAICIALQRVLSVARTKLPEAA
jgi:putative phage-type endonuclease